MSENRRSRPRSVSGALRAALAQAEDDGQVDATLDGAAGATAMRLAAALDKLDPVRDPYGYARVARVLMDCLREQRLTPVSRTTSGRDDLAEFLRQLAVPAPVDPAGAGPAPSG